ncbi:hypothetical protein TrVE_jg4738 [Triparma verrucosa]|uniref:tRNA/rRNA methyltransferase SpoU type domain-containing protein n=1 Tax=Triparma verrucosa TaxID=1606542 RepID=A0A9W7CIH9_9STRA|nr:hypothetical protein TrVE_jg4738 [Triparma verrucosa]
MSDNKFKQVAVAVALAAAAGFVLGRSAPAHTSGPPQKRNVKRGLRSKMVEGEENDFDTPGKELRVLRKAETVLQKRTTRLVCVIEKCTDVHNYSAVLRTAEALGIQNIYLIAPPLKPSETDETKFEPFDEVVAKRGAKNQQNPTNQRKKGVWTEDIKKGLRHNGYARTACKWINVYNFGSTAACLKQLKEDGFDVWVTDLGQGAECLRPPGKDGKLSIGEFPEKLAIVFGTESSGCTQEMLTAADKRVYLPLSGFADSLNLSVAAAMVIQMLFFMEPSLEGEISQKEKDELRALWYKSLARNAKEEKKYAEILASKGFPRPFGDMRRAGEHREGWAQKKVVKKNQARYEMLAEELGEDANKNLVK